MHKKVLVCLPLNDAHRAALEASVPEFEFRFNALDDVHAEDVLWADVVLGNAPVSMISQNKHIEWFQSNSAGPDAYLKPGVLPENCMVTNATGAWPCGWASRRICSSTATARTSASGLPLTAP